MSAPPESPGNVPPYQNVGGVIDGLLYLYPPGPNGAPSVTIARVPDGSGPFYTRRPSPGAANPELLNP